MFISIIKLCIIYLCSLLFIYKISNKPKHIITKPLYLFLISLALAIISFFFEKYFGIVTYALPLILMFCYTNVIISRPPLAFIITVVSFGLSNGLFMLSSFIGLICLYPLYNEPNAFPYPLLLLITMIIQIVFMCILFSIKRFHKGMSFLFTAKHINLITFVCIFFAIFLSYKPSELPNLSIRIISTFLFIFIYAFLIYWWQAQITKSYRRSLELRELESLRTEIAELNLKIQKLSEDNEKLARITHRDNTLITTLKNSTVKYLSTDFKNPAEAIAARDKLISNINALSAGRTSLPKNFNEKTPHEFNTNISLLNELLHHMDEKAIEHHIDFAVHFGTELENFIPKDISENDLVHTVDDLLKNAFKATITCEKRIVQLQFYKLGKHFVIEVADNGIPFETESLVNMGIEKRTTYADGSGIGLMDIWTTKNKYGATYHLEEYVAASPFSKKISLTFDKKNRYSIRTWRKNEILQICRRADLQVYDHSE